MLRDGLRVGVVLGLSAAACAGTRVTPEEHTLGWGGAERRYLVYAPETLGAGPHPVVLVFHGGGEAPAVGADSDGAESMGRYTGMNQKAEEGRFLVVYPAARTNNWNDGRNFQGAADQADNVDDVGFVNALLDDLATHKSVDPARVYATGISNGAMFSHRLACQLSQRIAAIAPVAGAMPENLAASCSPPGHVPVLSIHGTHDGFVPMDGGDVTAPMTRQKRGRVLSTESTWRLWAAHNGCSDSVDIVSQNRTPDRTSVETMTVRGCPDDGPVTVMLVQGGGHTWPGARWFPYLGAVTKEFHAEDVIWGFFQKHPR